MLITGGAGFIGSHVAEYYAKRDWEVVILDNLIRSKLFKSHKHSIEYNWQYLDKYSNIKKIKGDIRNKEDVKKALGKGVDVVIHTAAQPGVGFSIDNPYEDFSINAYGTLNVLKCLREISPQVTFIYCSTNKVYGQNVNKIPLYELETRYIYKDNQEGISETFPIDFTGHTPYGVSKYTGDMYVQEYGCTYGMKTAVFRMSCIYGPRQFGFEDQGWIAWFIIAMLTDKNITIYGDGKQVRDLLYVDDLIEAYNKFIESDIAHEVFNVGGGKDNTLSLIEFLGILEKELKKTPKISFAPWRASDQRVYISDITKIKNVLRWRPNTRLDKGIKEVVAWIRKNIDLFL